MTTRRAMLLAGVCTLAGVSKASALTDELAQFDWINNPVLSGPDMCFAARHSSVLQLHV